MEKNGVKGDEALVCKKVLKIRLERFDVLVRLLIY